jgi:hypothetical protein
MKCSAGIKEKLVNLHTQPTSLASFHIKTRAFEGKDLSLRHFVSRNSSVGIATGYGMDGRGNGVRFPAKARDLSLLNSIQTGSEAHRISETLSLGV